MKMKLAITFAFRSLFLIILLSLSSASSRAELWPAWIASYQPPSPRELGHGVYVSYSNIAGFTVDSTGSVFFVAPGTIYSNSVVVGKGTILVKLDVNGTSQWSTVVMPQPSDSFSFRKVAADNEGGCYVAGDATFSGAPLIWSQR